MTTGGGQVVDVIERVPSWVVALFCLSVAASWLPPIRFARTDMREGLGVAGFFLAVAPMATDSPGLVTTAVLLLAGITVWLIATARPERRRQHEARHSLEPSLRTRAKADEE